jgi:carbonic anhydrase
MKRAIFLLVAMIVSVSVCFASGHPEKENGSMTAEASLKVLKEGNLRFSSGKALHPRSNASRRIQTDEKGQKPIATILSCSDSRVPVETIFDQGIGDVFVIRVAGNVVGADETGTVEYGVEHLGTPLLIVLGHTKCGAVTAAVNNSETHGNVTALVKKISPAVDKAKLVEPYVHNKDLVDITVEANVWLSIESLLKDSYILRELVKEGRVKVVGAKYDLKTGRVEWMGEHKLMEQLLVPQADIQDFSN